MSDKSTFVPADEAVLSPSKPHRLLSAEVLALTQSLDVTSPGNGNAYDPDAFLRAITQKHDALMEVKDKLLVQAREQKALAKQLAEREAAVAFREQRVLAHERLLSMPAPTRRGSWLASFFRS